MISGSALCSSFKRELLEGVHNFTTDTFMMALYQSGASLSPDATTVYTTSGEVIATGYTQGGQVLTNLQLLGPTARTVYVTFDDPAWSNSSITARGALIYNQTKQRRAVAIADFRSDRTSNTGVFRVQLPVAGPSTALIRIR